MRAPDGESMMGAVAEPKQDGRVVGRYVLFDELASGGMATVHLGRLVGAGGFSRTVAIKRLHPHFAKDPDFRAMILDEARIVSRIQHTHVIPTLDVVAEGEDILLVMEYVHGEPAARLMRAARSTGRRLPVHAVLTIMAQTLYGLHAAHEARDDHGKPLNVVHRDVSPQNILVGVDGVTRVLDFGVAKAAGRIQSTRDGSLKGKLPYMPPEQIRGEPVDRRTDVYAAAVVLWEMLVGRMLFRGENDAAILHSILHAPVPSPGSEVPIVSGALDHIVMRGLARDPAQRYATALEMAEALQRVGSATAGEISALVHQYGAAALEARGRRVAEIESRTLVRFTAPPAMESNAPPPMTAISSAPPSPQTPAPASGVLEPTRVRRDASRSQTYFVVAIIAAITLLVGMLGIGWWLGSRTNDNQMPAPGATVLPAPRVSVAPIESAVPIATIATVMPSANASSTVVDMPKTSSAPSKTPPPRARNCNPPYTVDEDGIRIPKPECL